MRSWLADQDAGAEVGLPIAVTPPSETDLRRAVLVLERQLQPASYDHIVYCVAKLITGFNERLTKDEAKTRARLWREVVGEIPGDLWSTATIELLQTWRRDEHYGRVPEAADVLDRISAKLAKRRQDLDRCKGRQKATPAPAVEQPIPTRLGRLQHTRSIYERMGRTMDVERIDREIAAEQGLTAASGKTAADYSDPMPPAERPPYVREDTPTNRRAAELAEARRTGKPAPEQDRKSVV